MRFSEILGKFSSGILEYSWPSLESLTQLSTNNVYFHFIAILYVSAVWEMKRWMTIWKFVKMKVANKLLFNHSLIGLINHRWLDLFTKRDGIEDCCLRRMRDRGIFRKFHRILIQSIKSSKDRKESWWGEEVNTIFYKCFQAKISNTNRNDNCGARYDWPCNKLF